LLVLAKVSQSIHEVRVGVLDRLGDIVNESVKTSQSRLLHAEVVFADKLEQGFSQGTNFINAGMLGTEVSVRESNSVLSVVVVAGQAVQNELLTEREVVNGQFTFEVNIIRDEFLPIHSATICLRFSSGVSV